MVKYYEPSKIAALPKTYELCGYNILPAKDDLTGYFSVGYAFNQRAFLAQAEMTSYYENQITSMESILSTGVEIMERINRESCEFAVSVLMYYGIETVTPDELINSDHLFYDGRRDKKLEPIVISRIGKSDFNHLVSDNLKPIKDQIKKAQNFERELSFERQMQRRGRSHWQGGGFGFSGAVKGALMAGMMNAGASAIHGIGDSFIDAKDANRVSELKNMIVYGDMPLANFNYIVKTYVMYLWKITMGYLSATIYQRLYFNNHSPKFKNVSQAAIEEAIKKFSNYEMSYKHGSKTDEEITKATVEYLVTNCWDINAFRVLYLLHPTRRFTIIHDILPLYCLQYEFAPIAKAIDDDYLEELKERNDTEEIENVKLRLRVIDYLISADEDQLIDHYINGNKITLPAATDEKNAENTTNNTSESSSSGGCYIATAVYGSYDCPQVWTLRRYRDKTMSKNIFGRLFIHIYYFISPTMVKLFGDKKWFSRIFRKRLNKIVNKLNKSGYEDTPYSD